MSVNLHHYRDNWIHIAARKGLLNILQATDLTTQNPGLFVYNYTGESNITSYMAQQVILGEAVGRT